MSDFRLSVSKTKTFLQCKKQYEFVYVKKLPRKQASYHILGQLAHLVLEVFHKTYIEGSVEPYHVVMKRSWEKGVTDFKDKLTPEIRKECWDFMNKYLKYISNKSHHLSYKVLDVEKHFNFPIGNNIVLNGMIDRIQLDDDNVIHVADYKTSKSTKFLQKDFFQLLTYAYILLSENPELEKIRASYIMIRHDFEYITTEFLAEEILKVQGQYLEYARQINTETEFPATTTVLCNWCEFNTLCDDYKTSPFAKNVYGEVNW